MPAKRTKSDPRPATHAKPGHARSKGDAMPMGHSMPGHAKPKK